jgi:hypothetical protein
VQLGAAENGMLGGAVVTGGDVASEGQVVGVNPLQAVGAVERLVGAYQHMQAEMEGTFDCAVSLMGR